MSPDAATQPPQQEPEPQQPPWQKQWKRKQPLPEARPNSPLAEPPPQPAPKPISGQAPEAQPRQLLVPEARPHSPLSESASPSALQPLAPRSVLADPAPVPVWPRYALPGFAGVSVLNLVFEAGGPRVGFEVTKPLLMPLLAVALLGTARRVPPVLLVALLGSTVGDTMLLFSGTWFLVGMAGFAVTHGCYIALFRRGGIGRLDRTGVGGGAHRNRRRFLTAAAFYGLLWVVLITNLWSGLAGNMRVPVAGYSLLLVCMAIHAFAAGRRTGLGGALFLVSDTMIAGGLAHWHMPRGTGFAIMATYVLGQYLLATGLMDFSARRHPLRPAP